MHPSIEQYLAFLQTKRRAPATVKVVRHDLAHFVTWWEGSRRRTFDPASLRHEDLGDWRTVHQRDEGAAPATINRGLASLRGYCRWALARHLLLENPATEVKDVPTEPLAPRSLPAEAIDALLRATRMEQNAILRARNEALLALLIYAGLRVQEACDLQLRVTWYGRVWQDGCSSVGRSCRKYNGCWGIVGSRPLESTLLPARKMYA